MVASLTFWLLFAAAMLISSIGFYKYVYFISLGYGFSIAGLGVLMLILFRESLSIGTIIACALFFIYGIRLFAVKKSVEYGKHLSNIKSCTGNPDCKFNTETHCFSVFDFCFVCVTV